MLWRGMDDTAASIEVGSSPIMDLRSPVLPEMASMFAWTLLVAQSTLVLSNFVRIEATWDFDLDLRTAPFCPFQTAS
jgi:hypothetical protein